MGGRPAEFIYSSKGKASKDPLREVEEIIEYRRPGKRGDIYNTKGADTNNSLEYNNNSNTSSSPKYNNILFDSNNNETTDENGLSNKGTNESAGRNSGYSSNGTDITIIEDTNNYYPVEVNSTRRPV
jgi:hypothetical protein